MVNKDMWKISTDEVWALIPARGGSKSIPLKNLVILEGHPLIEYVINAAKKSKRFSRIICSTEDEQIAQVCIQNGIEVHNRPRELAKDDTPVLDVFVHLLQDIGRKEGKIANILPVLQPTSPFVLPEHIDHCIELLETDPSADSSQTITSMPHNFHAYNQRIIENGFVRFRFKKERKTCYNKQSKPTHYIFGNLVVTRASTVLEKGEIFGTKSLPHLIDFNYALDIDQQQDLELAEWLLKTGKVKLDIDEE